MPTPTFPTLHSGIVCKYPVTRRHTHRTGVTTFCDLSEQRYVKGSPLETFELKFTKVSTADKDTVRDFFIARKGELDTTWQWTFDSVLYEHLQFDQPQFDAVEESKGRWAFTLRIRQTRKA